MTLGPAMALDRPEHGLAGFSTAAAAIDDAEECEGNVVHMCVCQLLSDEHLRLVMKLAAESE